MPKLLRTKSAVSIQAAKLEGGLKRFRMVAYTGGAMELHGWITPVVVDLDSLDLSSQVMPILYNHDSGVDTVVGQSDRIFIDGNSVVIEGVVFNTPIADKIKSLAAQGFSWQASIGGDPKECEEVTPNAKIVVNGKEFTGPICVARGTKLKETSFVVVGADNDTSSIINAIGGIMDFETYLKTLGFDNPQGLSEGQRANLMQVFEAQKKSTAVAAEDDPEEEEEEVIEGMDDMEEEEDEEVIEGMDDPEEEEEEEEEEVIARGASKIRASAVQEANRIAGITQATKATATIKVNGKKTNLRAHAISKGWSVRKTKLHVMRASRPTAAAYIASSSRDQRYSLQALQGGLLLRCGGRLDHRAYSTHGAIAMQLPSWMRAPINDASRNRIMEAAHHVSQMSAVDLCREALRLDGKTAPRDRNLLIRAAVSSGTLSNIFTTNVNAQLLATFLEAPDTTAVWTQQTDVTDFKLQERPRLVKGGSLSKLPRGGTADHTSRSDEVESYRIYRYASQFSVDDQDLIDDMLGALQDMPVEMGNAAARLVPDLVYAIVLANPTLNATSRAVFNSTDGNLLAGSALASGTLKTGISTMMLFTENGVNVGQPPTHILVPPSLRFTAQELLQSTTIVVAGTAGSVTERGSANTLEGLVTPVVDPRLENGVTDPDSGTTYSGSATSWYLASNKFQTIEVAFLRGTGRAPQVRNFQLDRGQFGIGWDIKFDVGAKAMGWRGLLKANA